MTNERTLDTLEPEEKGVIVKLTGDKVIRRRLMSMGMTSQTLVEVIRKAPLGDPIDFKLKGYHLTLRKAEAEHVIVRGED